MKYNEQQRKEIRSLIEQGMSVKKAYSRMAEKYHQENKEPTFDYDKETPKGEFV